MVATVSKFRRLKNGDPEKLKVLVEDLPGGTSERADRFWLLVPCIFLLVAAGTFLAAGGWPHVTALIADRNGTDDDPTANGRAFEVLGK